MYIRPAFSSTVQYCLAQPAKLAKSLACGILNTYQGANQSLQGRVLQIAQSHVVKHHGATLFVGGVVLVAMAVRYFFTTKTSNTTEINRLSAENSTLVARNSHLSTQQQSAEAQLTTARASIDQLTQEKARLADGNAVSQAENQRTTAELTAAREEIDRLKQITTRLEPRNTILEAENQLAIAELTALHAQIDSLRNEIACLQAFRTSQTTQFHKALSEKQTEIDAVTRDYKTLSYSFNTFRSEHQEIKSPETHRSAKRNK